MTDLIQANELQFPCSHSETAVTVYSQRIREILKDYPKVIKKINPESIAVYIYTQTESKKSNVEIHPLYHVIYRTFYRMERAGLTEDFKKEYFQILHGLKSDSTFDLVILYKRFKNKSRILDKDDNSAFQISFLSKLLHTYNSDYPIYDSNVARALKLKPINVKGSCDKANAFNQLLCDLYHAYLVVINEEDFRKMKDFMNSEFNAVISDYKMSDVKVIDFLLWEKGDAMLKEAKL